MSALINDTSEAGIAAIVDQQFDYAHQILAAGLVPILEPEVSISSPHKEYAESLLRAARQRSFAHRQLLARAARRADRGPDGRGVNATLESSIEEIYQASVHKQSAGS